MYLLSGYVTKAVPAMNNLQWSNTSLIFFEIIGVKIHSRLLIYFKGLTTPRP